MNILNDIPWLEFALAVPLLGAVAVRRTDDAEMARTWSTITAGISLAGALAAWLVFQLSPDESSGAAWSLSQAISGQAYFAVDALNAPLLPLAALIYLVAILATARTKMRRFSFAWTLVAETLALATFACREPWILIALLAVAAYLPFRELKARRESTRVYAVHTLLFVALLIAGQFAVDAHRGDSVSLGAILPLLLAILVRCGIVPFHCWVSDLFERAAFGTSLTYIVPMTGIYAAVRLLLPVAPESAMLVLGKLSLVTAVYAAGMSLVQNDIRRFFCYQFLSQSALVMVGLDMHHPVGLAGGLSVWLSVSLALTGFGLTLRAVEARTGRLPLNEFHGLYSQMPTFAIFFLLTGLSSIGFPGTFGFIGAEMLIDAAVSASPYVGLAIVAAAALNGIALMRAYFSLFTGTHPTATVSLRRRANERFAVLLLILLIVVGGLIPQPGIESRYKVAEELLKSREQFVEEVAGTFNEPEISANR